MVSLLCVHAKRTGWKYQVAQCRLHVKSARSVARNLHTIAHGPLECTCWRQFAAQWGDCKNLKLRLSINYYYYYYYYYHQIRPRPKTVFLIIKLIQMKWFPPPSLPSSVSSIIIIIIITIIIMSVFLEYLSMWNMLNCAEQVQIQKYKTHTYKTLKTGVQIITLKHPTKHKKEYP